MENGEWRMENGEWGMGNRQWEMGNKNGKSLVVEIVVNAELNVFSGYYHIFWKRFAPK